MRRRPPAELSALRSDLKHCTAPHYAEPLAMPLKQFRPGFRLSMTDSLVLVAGAAGTMLAAQVEWWMGLIVGFAVGHFFLFCNVFRLARPLELAWSTLFVVLAGSTIITEQPGWKVTIGTTLVATLLVIAEQVRKPSYHGIAWQRLNPNLLEWWEAESKWRDRVMTDLERHQRLARNIAVGSTWVVWLSAIGLVITGTIHILWIYPLIVVGIGPYLLSIKIIEPWLARRMNHPGPGSR
jgi:hypothetical protein